MSAKKELTYADQRLAGIGMTAENYTFKYFPDKIDHWNEQVKSYKKGAEAPYLKMDRNGDMLIQYPALNDQGAIIVETEKSWNFYNRKRLANPRPGMPKYLSDKGAAIEIFIPQNTLEKARKNEEQTTLYMVEGELKSIYGDANGLFIVGLAGFHMFIARKESWEFHPTLLDILKRCKVKNICLIFDADANKVEFNWDNPEKDYAERLNNFCSAVIKFKSIITNYNETRAAINEYTEDKQPLVTPYYMQISELCQNSAKGLDDLYLFSPDNAEKITDEIKQLKTRGGSYFKCVNLENQTLPDIKRLFYLELDKNGRPTQFHNTFFSEIREKKFWFDKTQWVVDGRTQELVVINHGELQEYVRIGTDYYREIQRVEPFQTKENDLIYKHVRTLVPWKKETIVQDFVKAQGIKFALDYIRKFKSFCVVPAHDNAYRRIIDEQYNVYHPLPHAPKPGKWPNIEKFLRHLFDNEYQHVYNVALDLLYLKYVLPLQKLPVTVLYSKEKNTGKSTLLWLLNDIYHDNASLIGNKELEDNFDEYKTANVLLMDELIMEKQKHFETLKSWTTSPYSSMNRKSKERVKTVFFSTIFMTTNHLNFVSMDDDENRFFVCKVPLIPEKEKDPTLVKKMNDEIPAFLYYLRNEHKMTYPESADRFWFPVKAYETDILREVKNRGQKMVVKAMKEFVREMFFEYAIDEFDLTPVMILPGLRKFAHRQISNTELINSLKDDFNMPEPKMRRFQIPKWETWIDIDGKEKKRRSVKNQYTDDKGQIKECIGKPYRFEAEKWLHPDEMSALKELIRDYKKENKLDEI
jgi:hypothetical protein